MPRGQPGNKELTGILLVDKPAGWTSHDVVAKVRRLSGQRQIGHCGTLDPMATGLLVLCLGRATRLVQYLTAHDKAYEGIVQLGTSTNTDDAEGEVLERAPAPELGEVELRHVTELFTGQIQQVPPAFSAVKVAGQRAYAVARRGGEVALEPRPVVIRALQLSAEGEGRIGLRVTCSAGMYVRSLARDLGVALGTRGHLASLRRTRVGRFRVEEATALEALTERPPASFTEILLPADEGVADLAAAILEEEHGRRLRHGAAIRADALSSATSARLYTTNGEFIGMGSVEASGVVRPSKVLTD